MKTKISAFIFTILFYISYVQCSSIRSNVADELVAEQQHEEELTSNVVINREERALPVSASSRRNHPVAVEEQEEYNSYVCDWLDNYQYRCEEKYGCNHYEIDATGNVICTSHEASQRQWLPNDPFPEYFKLNELVPSEARGEVLMSCSFYPERERAQCYRDATAKCSQQRGGAECENPWDLTMITFKIENNRLLPGVVIDAADEASRTRRYHAEFDDLQHMESYDPYYRSVDMHL